MDQNQSWRESMEKRVTDLERLFAVEAVHRENQNEKLDGISGTLTWIVRLIIGGFVAALVAWVASGGLSIVP